MAVFKEEIWNPEHIYMKTGEKIMDSTGEQCWCNFLILLELASNYRDLLFFLPFLTDRVIVSNLRLFLHDIADKNTSLAQDAHDPQAVLWKSIMNFFKSFL